MDADNLLVNVSGDKGLERVLEISCTWLDCSELWGLRNWVGCPLGSVSHYCPVIALEIKLGVCTRLRPGGHKRVNPQQLKSRSGFQKSCEYTIQFPGAAKPTQQLQVYSWPPCGPFSPMMKHLPFWYTSCSFLTPLSGGSAHWAAPAAVHFAPRFCLKLSVSLCVAKGFAVHGACKGESHSPSWKANVSWCYVFIAQNKTESFCLAPPSEIKVSFFSSLPKLKEDVSFALCLCMGRDNRWKRTLISVLGCAWTRFSFSLWTGRAENQSNLIVIHLLLPPLHVLWAKFVPSHPSFPTPHGPYCQPGKGGLSHCALPAGGSLSHTTWHRSPLLRLPALLLSGDLEILANSSDKIPGPTPSSISQTIIQHHISSSQPWFSWLRDS